MNEMHSYSFYIRPLISMWMKSLGVDLFMTRTVHEFLWGFKDPLMSRLHALKPEVDEYFGLMYKVRACLGIQTSLNTIDYMKWSF